MIVTLDIHKHVLIIAVGSVFKTLLTPTGSGGGGGCVSGASDQQEEPSQSGASVWLGGSLSCGHAKGEYSKEENEFSTVLLNTPSPQ